MQEKITKLEEAINVAMEQSEDKETIQQLCNIKNEINGVKEESTKLQEDNKQLLKDYKEAMMHTSFTPTTPPKDDTPTPSKVPSFEDFLLDRVK